MFKIAKAGVMHTRTYLFSSLMAIMAIRKVISVSVPLPPKIRHIFYIDYMKQTGYHIFINDLQENDHRKQLYDAYCTKKTCYFK